MRVTMAEEILGWFLIFLIFGIILVVCKRDYSGQNKNRGRRRRGPNRPWDNRKPDGKDKD